VSKKQNNAEDRLNQLFSVMLEELNDKSVTDAGKAFAVERQVQRMRKRAQFNDRDLQPRAIADFISLNNMVGDISVGLADEVLVEAARYIEHVLERFTTSLDESNIQQSLDPTFLYNHWRFGPGASNGIRVTHTAEKIAEKMTCTVLCKPFVTTLRKHNTYFQLFDERNGNDGTAAVNGSRLTTVPKNETTHRTIAIEPSGNMALQLAAGLYIEDAMRMVGLDIRRQQPRNQLLALRGSIDGSLATIDLKSASDMFTLYLIRRLWPKRWYKLLTSLRSEYIDTGEGEWMKLNMISTMGNGFTFPMMTLSLVALIYAYRRLSGGPNLYVSWESTGVYGDDIIIPAVEYETCVSVLSGAGLIVNTSKSFSSGPFRESCGGDYWNGYDVTPFYVQSVENDAAIYVALNQVLEWGGKHNILLPRTILLLKSFLKGKVHLIPEWHNTDQGVLTSVVPRRYRYLMPKTERKSHKSGIFDVPLAAGGYLEAGQLDQHFFVPRLFKTRYKVKKARLPKGYLDGRDPIKRSQPVSDFVTAYTFLLYNDMEFQQIP